MNELFKLHQRVTELEASERKYRTLVETSPDIIYILDPKGRFSFVGDAVEDLLGFTAEELIGKHFSSIIWTDDLKKAIWRFNERRTGKRSTKRFEVRLITKEKKKKYFDIKYLPVELYAFGFYDKPVSSKDKEFLGTYGVARDINKRKRAEEVLRESEERYRFVVDNSNEITLILSKSGKILFANRIAFTSFGYSEEEIIGKSITKFLTKDSLKKALSALAQEFLGHPQPEMEVRVRAKSGEIKHLEMAQGSTPIHEKGKLIGVMINARDITQTKQATEALKESEEKYRTLVENSTDAILMMDNERRIVSCNQAFPDLFGYKKDELIGESIRIIYQSDDSFRSFGKTTDPVVEKVGFFRTEREFVRKNGTIFPVETVTSAIKAHDGSITGYVASIRGITERKQAEEKIKASLKEKEVMLKEIHHRVKNNMQVISSLLELQSGYIKDKEALEIFKKSTSHAKTMALIHEKLYQSKDLARIDFAEYVRSLAGYLLVLYRVSSSLIKLKVDIKNVFLDINTAIPCSLIINELVSNALKYAFQDGKKGKIKIVLHHINKNKFELIVSDNGIGFPKDLDVQNTESLGLQLVITLVRQLGGTIELHSNGGTEFEISFTP